MQVTRLFIHPVKSLGGIAVPRFAIDRFGPRWDRRWLVVDPQGRFLTQRQYARMAQITAGLEGDQITLRADGHAEARFGAADFGEGVIEVEVWRDRCQASRGPAWLDAWISAVLQTPAHLVFMPEDSRRLVDPQFARHQETVSFADGFPLLLATDASLQAFNTQLQTPVGMERFRPNLVIDGSAPYAEDGWRRIRVGSLEFIVAKPCSRCAIPTIDPLTAQKQPEVFKALKATRSRNGEVFFGQNLIPVGTGVISVGDPVSVLE
ncbi:MAG: MOSC domain-containing protein [Gammaproteobacteria bacterium]